MHLALHFMAKVINSVEGRSLFGTLDFCHAVVSMVTMHTPLSSLALSIHLHTYFGR